VWKFAERGEAFDISTFAPEAFLMILLTDASNAELAFLLRAASSSTRV
jgi:hypothetical protein